METVALRGRVSPQLCCHRRVPASLSGLNDEEFGQVAFVFETICSADCELYFMMVYACGFEASGADGVFPA